MDLHAIANRLPATLRAPHLSYFGILCGHMWVWDACHMASAQNPQLSPTVTIYIAMTLFMLGVTLAALAFKPRQAAVSWADWPVAALMAASTVLLTCPLPAGWTVEKIVPIAAVFGGIGMGWTYLQWSFFYARLDVRNAIACIFGAMMLGSILKLPIDLLPTWPAALICAALPFLSPALYRDAEARQPPAAPIEPYYTLRTLQPVLKIMLGVAAYGLVIGIMQGMVIEADPAPKWTLSGVHHLLEVLVAGVVLWFVFVRRRSLPFSLLWRMILAFTATGVLALPLFGRLLSGWALVVIGVAQTLVVMLLWAMLSDVAHRSSLPPLAVFGFGWVAYSLPFPIGQALGSTLSFHSAASSLVAVIVYLLAMASVFLLDERDFSRNRIFADLEQAAPPRSMFGPIEQACRHLGEQGGLTEREGEVMLLICQGRSKGYIAENLCISENTVRSHARHLYAKLGVHSKQDLLDLVLGEVGVG